MFSIDCPEDIKRPPAILPEDENFPVLPPLFVRASRRGPQQVLSYPFTVTCEKRLRSTRLKAFLRAALEMKFQINVTMPLAPSGNSLNGQTASYFVSVIALKNTIHSSEMLVNAFFEKFFNTCFIHHKSL